MTIFSGTAQVFRPVGNAIGRNVGPVLATVGIGYYLLSIGLVFYTEKKDMDEHSHQVGQLIAEVQHWPRVTDWRKYFLFVDKDGKNIITLRQPNGTLESRLYDNNANNIFDGNDYVEKQAKNHSTY